MRRQNYETWVAVVLILLAVLARLLPHPPNVSPALAATFFAGSVLTNRKLAYLVPLLALLASDILLGFYDGISFVYLAYAVLIALGAWMRPTKLGGVALGSLGSAVIFFILSNLGVWLLSGLYPVNFAGLVDCFILALPFFHISLLSTFASAFVLFALHARLRRVPGAVRVL